MTEKPDQAQTQGDPQLPKEITGKAMARSIQFALARSRGAAIIDVSKSEFLPLDIVRFLPAIFQHVQIGNIKRGEPHVLPEKTGLVVSGYSNGNSRERENEIQSYIRALANTRGVYNGRFQIAVLSDSLPRVDIFHNSSLPWFNGPFQGDDSAIWSVQNNMGRINLFQHKLEGGVMSEQAKWVVQKEIPMM